MADGVFYLLRVIFPASSQSTMPALTATLKECLVPYWGISMQASDISTTSSLTPFISCPKTSAYFFPAAVA